MHSLDPWSWPGRQQSWQRVVLSLRLEPLVPALGDSPGATCHCHSYS